MFPFLFRSVIFPLFNLYTNETDLSQLKKLNKEQWLPADLLELSQKQKLKKLLKHAVKNCNFYRENYSNLAIDLCFDSFTLSDINKLPIVSKKILQQNYKSMISDSHSSDQLFRNASGGSTGMPTVVFQDHRRRSIRQADAIFRDGWTGWQLGEKVAILWGAEKDFLSDKTWREKLRSICSCNVIELNAFELNDTKTMKYLNKLQELDITLIVGYVGALTYVSRFIIDHNVVIDRLKHNLKGIIATAERLTVEDRMLIEEAFEVEVFNRYGSRELGLIASECSEHDGLHVNSSCAIVEIVDDMGTPVKAGTVGRIIVTDLYNYGMPLIRYDTGDKGFMMNGGQCACGRNFPRLGEIVGRSSDFFVAVDGSHIHGEYFTHLVYGFEEIEQIQFIQEKNKNINIKIVASTDTLSPVIVNNIIDGCLNKLGEINVHIKYVNEIKPSSSGKYLFTYSMVNS